MKALLCFLIGVLVGVAGHWYFTQSKSTDTVAQAKESVRNGATNFGQAVTKTLDAEKIKDELARTGKVIREKARKAGDALADATANARTTAAIKAKLINEPNLSALKIDVDTHNGVVTLSGTVSSHEQIARAVDLALETTGVQKVISTLQVKAN